MEKIWLKFSVSTGSIKVMNLFTKSRRIIIFLSLLLLSCQAKYLKVENAGDLANIEEYDKKIKVEPLPVSAEVAQVVTPPQEASTVPVATPTAAQLKAKQKPTPKPTPAPKVTKKREPELEDSEGFAGRRPIVDPFWIGERVKLGLSYFGATAGYLSIETRPYVQVNGRKAYHFSANVKSTPFFSTFYSVDDYGETFMDYEEMIPYNFVVKVKESAQLREVRSLFDWKTMKASFWERKVTKKHGTQEKKLEWDIPAFSHNVFTAVWYLRAFQLKPGKVVQFRVADENRNMIVKAHVLQVETVEVDAGKFEALKIRPEVEMEGVFKPMGDVFFWLTNDERKQIIKIEAKIRIGTFKGEAVELVQGVRP